MITCHFENGVSYIIQVEVMLAPDARDLFGPVDGIVTYVDDDYVADCSSPLDLVESSETRLDTSDLADQ